MAHNKLLKSTSFTTTPILTRHQKRDLNLSKRIHDFEERKIPFEMLPCGNETVRLKRSAHASQDSTSHSLFTRFLAIFAPVMLCVFLVLLALFQCWVRSRRRSRIYTSHRANEESTLPHPHLFEELNDSYIGTRVIELGDVMPRLHDETIEDEPAEFLPFIPKNGSVQLR